MIQEYKLLPLKILRKIAKNKKIKKVYTFKKNELIECIKKKDNNKIKNNSDNLKEVCGILEILRDGYGFIRGKNYLSNFNDIYVSNIQIKKFNLKTGDILHGNVKINNNIKKFSALSYIKSINGINPNKIKRLDFESMTPILPNKRIYLEYKKCNIAMRIIDLMSPIGKGQRGIIVSPPKVGKTTILKNIGKSIIRNNPEIYLIILLIDERPEEVTDMKESIYGEKVEIIYSTFDEIPERHIKVSEMAIEHAKRLVEHKKDVVIFIDSITRLTRSYNLVAPSSGRTLSGGLDPTALHMPKRFFGAARNMKEGGSLTIIATALIDTGSKMDDVIYEEFKGTGNMEIVLNKKLQEERIFPAIDIIKSGTRRDDILLNNIEQNVVNIIRKTLNCNTINNNVLKNILHLFINTSSNNEFLKIIKNNKKIY